MLAGGHGRRRCCHRWGSLAASTPRLPPLLFPGKARLRWRRGSHISSSGRAARRWRCPGTVMAAAGRLGTGVVVGQVSRQRLRRRGQAVAAVLCCGCASVRVPPGRRVAAVRERVKVRVSCLSLSLRRRVGRAVLLWLTRCAFRLLLRLVRRWWGCCACAAGALRARLRLVVGRLTGCGGWLGGRWLGGWWREAAVSCG
jgi:hypothetical protein